MSTVAPYLRPDPFQRFARILLAFGWVFILGGALMVRYLGLTQIGAVVWIIGVVIQVISAAAIAYSNWGHGQPVSDDHYIISISRTEEDIKRSRLE